MTGTRLYDVQAWGVSMDIDNHFDEDLAVVATLLHDGTHVHADLFTSISSELYNDISAELEDPSTGSEPWWTMLPQIMNMPQ